MICQEESSLLDSEIAADYQPVKGGNAILPSTASTDRNAQGLLTDAAVTRIVADLKRTMVIPPSNISDADRYRGLSDAFLTNVRAEYCHYETRYMRTLKLLFNAIRSNQTATVTATISQYLTSAQRLNTKMNDILQIIKGITDNMMSTSSQLKTEMTALNEELQAQKASLNAQKELLQSNESAAKLEKQMVKYTEEKARRTNNLLSMYSVMNIVALGLLVYIYQASSDE